MRFLLLKQKKIRKQMVGYEEVTRLFTEYKYFKTNEEAFNFINSYPIDNSKEVDGITYSYRLIDFEEISELKEPLPHVQV